MNEYESDWISLSQSQNGVRVFFEWIWEKITRCLNPRWQCLNPTLENSEWLPSSSWVRMNEIESDWTSLSQSFVQNGWIQDGRIQDGCHHKLIRLNYFESGSELRKSVFELIWEKITRCLNPRWQCLRPRWQNSKWLQSSGWVTMNEFVSDWTSLSQSFVQNGWIQDGTIQDGCHQEVEWQWMSSSQIELVWVRVLCKMAESNIAEFKMAAIIKLSQNEWDWVRLN